jgi:hypothetical protein
MMSGAVAMGQLMTQICIAATPEGINDDTVVHRVPFYPPLKRAHKAFPPPCLSTRLPPPKTASSSFIEIIRVRLWCDWYDSNDSSIRCHYHAASCGYFGEE